MLFFSTWSSLQLPLGPLPGNPYPGPRAEVAVRGVRLSPAVPFPLGLRCPCTSTNAIQVDSLYPMVNTCSCSALLQQIQEDREQQHCWLEMGNGKYFPQLLLSPSLSWSRKAQQGALFHSPGRTGGESRRQSSTQKYFYSYCIFAANVVAHIGFTSCMLSLLAVTINEMEKSHQRTPSVSVKT